MARTRRSATTSRLATPPTASSTVCQIGCGFLVAEPIKNEEFELLIKYQPCLYAESFLAHGTGRGLAWVNYMTTLLSQSRFDRLKTMEIFGRTGARLASRQRSVQGRHGHVPQSLHGGASPGPAVSGYELFLSRPLAHA